MKDPEKIKKRKIEIRKSKMLVSLGITKEQYERDVNNDKICMDKRNRK